VKTGARLDPMHYNHTHSNSFRDFFITDLDRDWPSECKNAIQADLDEGECPGGESFAETTSLAYFGHN